MFRTLAAVSRLYRISPNIHKVLSPIVANSVRFKYQNRGGGDKTGRKKGPQTTVTSRHDDYDDEDDDGDATPNDEGEHNLLEDK